MKTQLIYLIALSGSLSLSGCSSSVEMPCEIIRINQLGYYPSQEKIAIVDDFSPGLPFDICDASSGKVVFQGTMKDFRESPFSDRKRGVVDFTSLSSNGKYKIRIDGFGSSYPFEIRHSVLSGVAESTLKAFYFQRTGMAIDSIYAGRWARPMAHADTNVMIHPSAASASRPAGSLISSPKGWYDAGDYNKYIVNSAFTVSLMMDAYQCSPDYYNRLLVNIPESSNNTPDILDEVHYNLDWMLSMQDPSDGGVYHKLTTPGFEGFVKPEDCSQQRYVVAKSTAATLGFAASMAMAARVYVPFQEDYPEFSDRALDAAEYAFRWARKNKDVIYDQNSMNSRFIPAVSTGEYGDRDLRDEFFWAATELYLSTHKPEYLKIADEFKPVAFSRPSWGGVDALGIFSLSQSEIPDMALTLSDEMKVLLVQYCDSAILGAEGNNFFAPFGNKKSDFGWGSISEGCMNQAISLIYAYKVTGSHNYLLNALRNNDYALGKNATGYCFITGSGSKSPANPHHRLAANGGVIDALPGFLVGGPNPQCQDDCLYPSRLPDESYVDIVPSYASNEIAINWNASAVFLEGVLDDMMSER